MCVMYVFTIQSHASKQVYWEAEKALTTGRCNSGKRRKSSENIYGQQQWSQKSQLQRLQQGM